MQNQPQLTQISAAAFAAKFQSKREVYRFLSSEVRAYLPGYETVTVWHLRDLAMGVKRIIKCDDVKVIAVPQFEGLAIKEIFEFAMNSPAVEAALPPSKEITKLSRGYLSNVIYTVLGEPFQTWVTQQVNIRNKKVALEGNNVISMDPQIAQIFQQSTAISVSKGKSSFLMKASAQRRKSRAQIQEEKLVEEQKQAAIAEKMRLFDQMQQEVHDLSGMKQQVDQMFEQGYIYKQADGSLGLASNEEERAAIAESASKVVPANSFILQSPAVKKNLDSAFDDADY